MKIEFNLRFTTRFGQALFITGNHPLLGNGNVAEALPMAYLNEEFWQATLDLKPLEEVEINYRYLFKNDAGEMVCEGEKQRCIAIKKTGKNLVLIDSWNAESFVENAFYTTPFTEVFLKPAKKTKPKKETTCSHQFRVKAPLLQPDQSVCLLGSGEALGNWNKKTPVLFSKRGDWWTAELGLDDLAMPLTYKYGVYDTVNAEFANFENGDNRLLYRVAEQGAKIILHDAFVRLPITWKGAGIAIPVFSLRTNTSFGIGEFNDIKCLTDWAKEAGIKMLQLLPINDTSATQTWKDSYPYAAISAFALHPGYISLAKVAGKKNAQVIKLLIKKQKQLNELPTVDYEQVMQYKMKALRELYVLDEGVFLTEANYESFFDDNKTWLIPYAAFCFNRDKWGTADFSKWKLGAVYNEEEILRMSSPKSKSYKQLVFFYFVQYHLHLQLKEAVDYAHKKGIAIKGDIPIGIYRYGADAWTAPHLYHMELQAGAPPDDFAVKGQNWGFPTYNWPKMEEDHFEWWKLRFHQMSNYFDAFRIDHILGFFRIWSVPVSSIEGIMGMFIPALPVSVHELGERSIWFDYTRYCTPFIIDPILDQFFAGKVSLVKEAFLEPNKQGGYAIREEFNTQQKVEAYFLLQEQTTDTEKLKQGLFDLLSNVIFFEEENSGRQRFHFRINMERTSSFHYLDDGTKYNLSTLYIDYFYRRQDEFWKAEALRKLPALKEATNMLICGEDLGMVPNTVPGVMKQLGILSLEVQRMPKDSSIEFFHPKYAPYLSVVTPSTHDMSTIRGWWEEDRARTQTFFNQIMGEQGPAPYFCEPWVARAIILQHLYSPAMWSIFQLQDILAMSDTLRRQNPAEERINEPSNPTHYWNYRMHIPLEQLIKETAFNKELKDYIHNSGRAI